MLVIGVRVWFSFMGGLVLLVDCLLDQFVFACLAWGWLRVLISACFCSRVG